MTNTHEGWEIRSLDIGLHTRPLAGENVWMVQVNVRHTNGDTLSLSHRADDPAGTWGIDAAFRANGMPLWSNDPGARYLRVHRPTPEFEAWLTDAAHQAGLTDATLDDLSA